MVPIDDTVGMLEILNGGAFAQEFRIRHHRAVGIGPRFADDALDLVAGAHRHRRLGDDDGEAVERARDLARGVIDEVRSAMPVAAARRRTDRNEYRIGLGHRAAEFRREFQPAGTRVDRDQIVEARLIDRHLAARQRRDLSLILVDANDLVAEIGETGAGNKADISGADHRDTHLLSHPQHG